MVASVFEKQSVLVTGGLGFVGSSLALRLVRLGASVTVVDSSVQGCGTASLDSNGGSYRVASTR